MRTLPFILAALFNSIGTADPITMDRFSVDLISWPGTNPQAGTDGALAVILDIEDHWHLQAGAGTPEAKPDAIPTELEITAPEGWTIGQPVWPAAADFKIGEGLFAQEASGYEGRVLVVFPTSISAEAAGATSIALRIAWQACDDQVCEMPGEDSISFDVNVLTSDAPLEPLPTQDATTIREALASSAPASSGTPTTSEGTDADGSTPEKEGALDTLRDLKWWLSGGLVVLAMGWMIVRTFAFATSKITQLVVLLGGGAVSWGAMAFVLATTSDPHAAFVKYQPEAFQSARDQGKTVLVKFTADWCANCQVNERIMLASDAVLSALSQDDVVAMKVDFSAENPEGDALNDKLGGGGIPLIGVWPPSSDTPITLRGPIAPDASDVLAALRGETTEASEGETFDFLGLRFSVASDATFLILLLAFAAGFLMNFTPCVLPVIPLKVLSLQAHAKSSPAKALRLGLVFSLGILALYGVLGILMAGVGGLFERLDWGEQFEKWWLSGLLGLIVGGMGVGMIGLFEIRLPAALTVFNPTSETAGGSFFMGVFTAVLSTPCTGPLLGATVAWTATQPPVLAFLTLLVMGAGMAFPYLLLTAKPNWLSALPRSGPGSVLLKQVMGMLLVAVAIWFLGNAGAGLLPSA